MEEDMLNTPYIDAERIYFEPITMSQNIVDTTSIVDITPNIEKWTERWNYNKEQYIENEKLEKLEKVINEMAKFINKLDVDEEICSKVKLGTCEKYNNGNCEKCIIKYFEDLCK